MLKELLEAKYQNFYVNDDGVICGIVTPKQIWKLSPEYVAELQAKYRHQIDLTKGNNFDLYRKMGLYAEKALKRLNAAVNKLEAE